MSIKDLYGDILQKRVRNVKFPKETVENVIKYFLTPDGEMTETEAKIFITKHMELLNFRPIDFENKFKEYAKLGWKKTDITKAVNKFHSFICYNVQDVKDKVMILKDLGYTSRQIINEPKILSCPSKDIKLKFMFAKLFNFDTKKISYFIQSFEKTYFRTCFLAEVKPELFEGDKKVLTKEILRSTNKFTRKYQVGNDDLKYMYRLTIDTIEKIKDRYNKFAEQNDLPYIELTDEEKAESMKRSDLKIIRDYIKNYGSSKEN